MIERLLYDITKYTDDHPGGVAVLHEVAGTNATEVFEEIGHSVEANEALSAFYLGELADEDYAEEVEVFRPTFHDVGQTAAVIVHREKRKERGLRHYTIPAITAAAAIGATTWVGGGGAEFWRRRGTEFIRLLRPLISRSLTFPLATNSERLSLFWCGASIATAAEASLSVIGGAWAWSRLEAQKEFTHYPARRASRSNQYMATLNIPTSSSSPKASGSPTPTRALDPHEWRRFKLVRKTLVSPNVYRLVFALQRANDVLGLPTGQHIALRATVGGKTVARSYTPVSNNSDLGRIEMLVKVYDKGLMTKHLEGMEVGETIDIRGPKGSMQYQPLVYAKHIGMVAGGTGITPMFQVIRAICEDESDTTTMSLLYANNTEADILLREELDAYMKLCPGKLRVHYVLARPSEGWTGSSGFVNAELIKEHLPAAAEDTKMLLCGPPPMTRAVSKCLVELGFRAPSAISKAADQIFLF